MDIQTIIQNSGGIEAVASQLGISREQAHSGVSALLPAVLGGLKTQAQGHPQGLDGLLGMLGGLGGGGLLDNVVGPEATQVDKGQDILG